MLRLNLFINPNVKLYNYANIWIKTNTTVHIEFQDHQAHRSMLPMDIRQPICNFLLMFH